MLLALLVGMQVIGSVWFIVSYWHRRIQWKLDSRKGKKRTARAAKDAMGIKVPV